jgi:hypothetical protein
LTDFEIVSAQVSVRFDRAHVPDEDRGVRTSHGLELFGRDLVLGGELESVRALGWVLESVAQFRDELTSNWEGSLLSNVGFFVGM